MHHIQTNITQKMNFRSLKQCEFSLFKTVTFEPETISCKSSCATKMPPTPPPPLQIPTVRCGYALSNVSDSERCRMIFTLGDHVRNLGKFSVLAIAKSLYGSVMRLISV